MTSVLRNTWQQVNREREAIGTKAQQDMLTYIDRLQQALDVYHQLLRKTKQETKTEKNPSIGPALPMDLTGMLVVEAAVKVHNAAVNTNDQGLCTDRKRGDADKDQWDTYGDVVTDIFQQDHDQQQRLFAWCQRLGKGDCRVPEAAPDREVIRRELWPLIRAIACRL